jgi:signal transduction histidine kinase
MGRSGDKGLVVAAAAVALTGVVALLDYLTPTDADFGGFYMLPVILAAWFVGRTTGVAIALLGMAAEAFVDTTLRLQDESASVAIAGWNASTHFVVLSALALITDGLYRQRKRWQELDAERTTLLRVLEQELPRPLRAADWFARTFEDALASSATPAVKAQFTALRHHTSEAMFLATDLLALGKLRMGGIRFARVPVALKAVAAEAVDASLDRSRVLLSSTDETQVILADPDRLRHAIASVIARFLEMSPYEPVTIFIRASGDEAVLEITCRARDIDRKDVELTQLLVNGNGGRLVLVPQSSPRGATVAMYYPRIAPAADASTTPPAEPERVPRT